MRGQRHGEFKGLGEEDRLSVESTVGQQVCQGVGCGAETGRRQMGQGGWWVSPVELFRSS